MDLIAFVAGFVLLLLLVAEVHSTVFVPRGQSGLISRSLYSFSWRLWKRLGRRLSGKKRRAWLAQLGPILVPLTVLIWGALLVLSFALMYAPWVEDFGISPAGSGPMADWALALYYSGYSAVTLGVGDVTPNGTFPRLMAVVEAGFGFALFTSAVTYLLAVYNALNRSTSLALAISRFVGRRTGGTPISLLASVAHSDAEEGLREWLGRMAFELASLVELRGQYPLLHYFHEPNDDRSVSIAIADVLELVTLCRSVLDPERYPALAKGPTVNAVDRVGRHYLAEFDTPHAGDPHDLEVKRWQRYTDARRSLANAGIALRPDEESWSTYEAIAREWDVADNRMREWQGYWSTVGSR